MFWECIEILAEGSKSVDNPFGGSAAVPWIGDFSYHFDTEMSGMVPCAGMRELSSSLEVHDAQIEFLAAAASTTESEKKKHVRTGIWHLGRSLHPLQDESSHQRGGKGSQEHMAHLPLWHAPAWICTWREIDPRWKTIGGATDDECDWHKENNPNWADATRPDIESSFRQDVGSMEGRTRRIVTEYIKRYRELRCCEV